MQDNTGSNKLIVIVGPTGSGKTDLAVELAKTYPGEVISADSRQIYRYLDIGTAKPSLAERGGVPHHLFDIIDPGQDFNLAEYQGQTYQVIDGIQSSAKLPFLVGGSGLYVWAVVEGWQIPQVAPDWELRNALEKRARDEGADALYQQLVAVDAAAAESIDRHNIRRVIRALEVRLGGGNRAAEAPRKKTPPYSILIIGLTAERRTLYERVDFRIDKMIESGLVAEVSSVLDKGYAPDTSALKSVGYKEAMSHLRGELDIPAMAERIKAETHRLIRHQYNWFRLIDSRIHWLDIQDDYVARAKELIKGFLEEKSSEYGIY
ncbi:tRNA (adenosine(37)-N6)-dimethylallyltransferase MiaA [Dehalogenimonas sp. THU2]|uniref:tRNA (adenosine(37)-N6)-dimethylallyltransferase MiaA n=1 Tax=Dehalogenimonas sp. THU2 TaxID=3151121 RepID=UPI003218D6CA